MELMECANECLNELATSHNALQVMLFDDDSVDIQFKDHSSLQLSPCGANYQYVKCTSGVPTIPESSNVIRQRCNFATSETKVKVEFALKWRNHFAARPYIPSQFSHLSNEDIVHLYKDISSFQWPSCEDGSAINGVLNIYAKDEIAKVKISKNKHLAEVDFLVKLSPCTSRNPTPSTSPRESKSYAARSKDASKQNNDVVYEKSKQRKYVWLKHIFPVSSIPSYWKYPVNLIIENLEPQKEKQCCKLLNVNHAPQSLASVCKQQFRHKWRMNESCNEGGLILPSDDENLTETPIKSIKMLWNNNTTYWITKAELSDTIKEQACCIEVWLSDGSVLKSVSSSKHYFTHMKFKPGENICFDVESQRMYSPSALPMHAELKTVVLRSLRLRSYAEQQYKDFNPNSKKIKHCWQDTPLFGDVDTPIGDIPVCGKLTNLYETAFIPNLGKFSAVGGSIQIAYDDGTTLHIAISENQMTSISTQHEVITPISCRILLANGQYVMCDDIMQTENYLAVYTKPATDWLKWISNSKEQRMENVFYSDTMFSSEKLNMVSMELDKINRFNYILEQNSVFSNNSSSNEGTVNEPPYMELSQDSVEIKTHTKPDAMSKSKSPSSSNIPYHVANALHNTSQAITDIDDIIKSLRCNF